MKNITIWVLFIVTINLFACNIMAQEKDFISQANQLYAESKYEEAKIAYQNLLKNVSDPPTRAKIIYNLGMTYQQLADYKKAIETFDLVFSMPINDKEPGGNLMQAYRNYRHSAQWEIGNSYFEMGDFEKALGAFQTAKEKYPYQSWCGTCRSSIEGRYYKTIAICLENLERYDEAVGYYMKIGHPRVLEIYEFNGQLNDIKRIVEAKEEPKIIELQNKYAWTRDHARKNLPTQAFDKFFEVYELEKNKNISGLMKLAVKRQSNYYANITAKMLARHPKEVLPLAEIELNKTVYPYTLYKVLGYIGSPESLKVLSEKGKEIVNSHHAVAFVQAVNLSGELGRETLSKLLQEEISENMRWAINRNIEKRNKATNDKDFPLIKKAKLPMSL